MESNVDWEAVRTMFSRWWRRENVRRPLVVLTNSRPAPADGSSPSDMNSLWLEQRRILEAFEGRLGATQYWGEAFPYMWPDLGPGSFGTFLGAEPQFYPDTVWYKPLETPIHETSLEIDCDSRWWQWSLSMAEQSVRQARGRWLVAIPDLVENMDTLAALFGTESMLLSLHDNPDAVHRLQKELLPLWETAYDSHYSIVKDDQGWSSFAAFSIWGPGRTAKVQCDISAMLSPAMFDEFVAPYLQQQCRFLDSSIYHLDGRDAVKHLPSLLEIDGLDCIQWTPGAGEPDGGDPEWDDIYRQTLDSGRCIHAHMPLPRVRDFVRRFGSTGVMVLTQADSDTEAQALLQDLS